MSIIEFRRLAQERQQQYGKQYLQRIYDMVRGCRELVLVKLSERSKRDTTGTLTPKSNNPRRKSQKPATIETLKEEIIMLLPYLSCKDLVGSPTIAINSFCKQFGIDRSHMNSMTQSQMLEYISRCLLNQLDVNTKPSGDTQPSEQINKKKGQSLQWININSKFQHLQEKVKRNLVQILHEQANEKLLKAREEGGGQNLKLQIPDEPFLKTEAQELNWEDCDEQTLQQKINQLKYQFSDKNFLKKCQRFKFIPNNEFEKIASDQYYRKVNHRSDRQLSREHILKKCLEKEHPLTQQQVKYIMNTSPLMSKSINKTLMNQSILKIDKDVIDRIELKIADEILNRYQDTVKAVKVARRHWREEKVQATSEKILKFEKKQMQSKQNQKVKNLLKKQKSSLVRRQQGFGPKPSKPYMTRPSTAGQPGTRNILSLNKNHPPSAIFFTQNNDLSHAARNSYEQNYLKSMKIGNFMDTQKYSADDFRRFYSGGNNTAENECEKQKAMIKDALKSFANQEFLRNCPAEWKQREPVLKTKPSTAERKIQTPGIVSCKQLGNVTPLHKSIEERMERERRRHVFAKMLASAAQNSFLSLETAKILNFTKDQVNVLDRVGNPALYYAAKFQNVRAVQLLVSMSADPNVRCQHNNQTVMHVAFRTNNIKVILECLTQQADLNLLDGSGLTPLGHANRQTLKTLSLLNGITSVAKAESGRCDFDNNKLVRRQGESSFIYPQ